MKTKTLAIVGALVVLTVVFSVLSIAGVVEIPLIQAWRDNKNNDTVAATVNGEVIYEGVVKSMKAGEEISYQNSLAQLETQDLSEEVKADLRQKLEASRKNEATILDELIAKRACLQKAKELGFKADTKAARERAKTSYRLAKEAAEQKDAPEPAKQSWEIVQAYLREMSMSEEEYIAECTAIYEQWDILSQLQAYVEEHHPNGTKTFEEYKQAVVAAADIEKFM